MQTVRAKGMLEARLEHAPVARAMRDQPALARAVDRDGQRAEGGSLFVQLQRDWVGAVQVCLQAAEGETKPAGETAQNRRERTAYSAPYRCL